MTKLWTRGGFPSAILARDDAASHEWRQNFVRTFVEPDLPQPGVTIAADTMRRFWTILAHHQAQLWNSSELARAFDVADKTVRGYLDRLSDALVVRQLAPWHENLAKRRVKSPKVYERDTGLLHSLLGVPTQRDLMVVRGRHRVGFEIKHTSAPSLSPSMRTALSDLNLESLAVVHSGAESFAMSERIDAIAATDLAGKLAKLR